ncbi:hypothetical protein LOC72_21335 [Roseiconus lacunae]|nr:hypothetical protein [Roseiconus lacunae]
MSRFRLQRAIGIAVVITIATTLLVIVGTHFYRVHLCESILSKIDQLASHPPPDATDLEWAVHVYWTHNLHCNSMPLTYASTDALHGIEAELSDAMISQPGRATIDRLWDAYSEMTHLGAEYKLTYEHEKNRIAEVVALKGLRYEYIEDYRSFAGSRGSK